jgi:hypothetical protein
MIAPLLGASDTACDDHGSPLLVQLVIDAQHPDAGQSSMAVNCRRRSNSPTSAG